MFDNLKKELETTMNKALDGLKLQFSKLRTGRASPSVLDGIVVDYYGSPTPLKQLGQISTPEARLLQIQPFDKMLIGAIEKAIFAANIGLTPNNDGNLIRIPFPALTEEKRKDQVKEIKKIGEDAKVNLRNIRRDKNELVKKAEKDKKLSEDLSKKHQDEVQKTTDSFIKKIDDLVAAKEKEVMTL